jgi:predicted methyltransferase
MTFEEAAMHRNKFSSFALSLLVVGIAACASTPATPTDPVTAAALDKIIAGDHRSEAARARDVFRHPKETLLFFGIKPNMTVVEVWPGGNGWYTEIIAPLVSGQGKYYAAHWAPAPENKFITDNLRQYADKLAARPDLYGSVTVTALGANNLDIAPEGSADMVVTFRNIHNWMARDFDAAVFASIYKALKPGGILGVVEHRGNPKLPQDPRAKNGYVNEAYAIDKIKAAGFEFVGSSEINANPKDTKDYEQGVWTLPPTFRLGDTDRAKYAAIGESDRFTLKFRKPTG